MKLTVGELLERLCLVACVTGSDILANVVGQLGPPVVPGDELQCLEAASMSGNPCVVVLLHNLVTEVRIYSDPGLDRIARASVSRWMSWMIGQTDGQAQEYPER
jgi:hypothetical protein